MAFDVNLDESRWGMLVPVGEIIETHGALGIVRAILRQPRPMNGIFVAMTVRN